MRALVALKDADFQILDCVWRPSRQVRIAAAVFTAKRSNKLLVLHKEGMLVHNQPLPTAPVRGMRAILGARSALRRPGPPTRRPWWAEDGREKATSCARRGHGKPTGKTRARHEIAVRCDFFALVAGRVLCACECPEMRAGTALVVHNGSTGPRRCNVAGGKAVAAKIRTVHCLFCWLGNSTADSKARTGGSKTKLLTTRKCLSCAHRRVPSGSICNLFLVPYTCRSGCMVTIPLDGPIGGSIP